MLYQIMLFLHVTGALMLCAAMTIEWMCVITIRKADTMARIREALSNYARLSKIGGISMLLILVPGIYLMAAAWHGSNGIFAVFGFIGLILLGAVGGIVTGRKMNKIRKTIKTGDNLSSELESFVSDNSLWLSIRMRTAIFLGVVFLMTVKPGLTGSIVTLVVSVVIGLIPLRMKTYSATNEIRDAV